MPTTRKEIIQFCVLLALALMGSFWLINLAKSQVEPIGPMQQIGNSNSYVATVELPDMIIGQPTAHFDVRSGLLSINFETQDTGPETILRRAPLGKMIVKIHLVWWRDGRKVVKTYIASRRRSARGF